MELSAFRDRVLHDDLPALDRDDVPAWLKGELTRAMSTLPSERHASAHEFAQALRRGALGLDPTPPAASAGAPVVVPARPTTVFPPPAPASPSPQSPPTAPVSPAPVRRPASLPAARQPAANLAAAVTMRRPEAGPGPTDEGGWLGPVETTAASAPATAHQPLPVRRFDDLELTRGSRRRTAFVAVLVGIAVVALAATAVLMLIDRRTPPVSAPPTSAPASPTTIITPSTMDAPRGLRLTDRGRSVVINWQDPSAGAVSFLVIGWAPGGEQLQAKQIPNGTTTATYTGLDSKRNYCFTVGAVYSVRGISRANPVCTKRPGR
jgi:hypothetical protein